MVLYVDPIEIDSNWLAVELLLPEELFPPLTRLVILAGQPVTLSYSVRIYSTVKIGCKQHQV